MLQELCIDKYDTAFVISEFGPSVPKTVAMGTVY